MGLIAFPFILCLLTSPFVIGGVLLYMWHEDRKARGSGDWVALTTSAPASAR